MKIIFDLLQLGLIRFGLGGVPGLAFNCSVLFVSSFLDIEEKELMFIAVITFLIRETLTFTIHRKWTFKAEASKKELKEEIISFIVVTSLITAANTIWFYIFAKKLHIDPTISQVILSLSFFFVNLPAMKEVFTKIKKSSDA